jgi:hypothetical protein
LILRFQDIWTSISFIKERRPAFRMLDCAGFYICYGYGSIISELLSLLRAQGRIFRKAVTRELIIPLNVARIKKFTPKIHVALEIDSRPKRIETKNHERRVIIFGRSAFGVIAAHKTSIKRDHQRDRLVSGSVELLNTVPNDRLHQLRGSIKVPIELVLFPLKDLDI